MHREQYIKFEDNGGVTPSSTDEKSFDLDSGNAVSYFREESAEKTSRKEHKTVPPHLSLSTGRYLVVFSLQQDRS